MRFLKADTAATVRIGPAVSISDGYTATASLAISTADYAYISDASGTETDISSNTWAAVASVTGWYDLTLTAGQLGVEGPLTVMIYDVSLCLPVWADFHVVNANVYDSLFAAAATDYQQVDATQLGGVTQSLTDLKDFADDGYDPATNKVQGVVLTDTVTTLTGHTAQTGDSYPYAKLAKYIGPEGPGVYYDDSAANTNTTLGTDGTYDNAVSTLAAALTLVTSLGVKRIYVTNSSTLALTGQTMSDYSIIGIGLPDTNKLNLGTAASASVLTNFVAKYMYVYGTHDLSDRINLIECIIDDAPAAEITKFHILSERCKLAGDFTIDTSSDNIFDNWSSAVAGNGYPVCNATGAAGTVVFRHGSGGIGLESLSASHKVSVETDGQVIFESACNVNAEVVLRGNLTIVDNTAGMSNLTRDAALNGAYIADTNWDEVLTGATHNVADSAARRLRNLQEFGTYQDDSVWIDTVSGTAGTTDYESGTILNKVDSIADANTIGTSLGLNGRAFTPGSSVTLAASQDYQNLWGNNWTLALGGQSVSATHILGANVSGTCTGAIKPEFHACQIGAVTVPPCRFIDSDIEGTITLPVGSVDLHHSAGEAGGILDFGAAVANTTVNWTDFSGEIVVDNLGQLGTDILNIAGEGRLTLNASCVGGTINLDGHITVTNNGSGITINEDNVTNTAGLILEDTGTTIPALINSISVQKNAAFSNFEFLMVLASDHATPGTGLTVTGQRSIDGGAFASVSGSIAEVSNGIYQFDALAADTNGDVITWRFSAATADDVFITFKTIS